MNKSCAHFATPHFYRLRQYGHVMAHGFSDSAAPLSSFWPGDVRTPWPGRAHVHGYSHCLINSDFSNTDRGIDDTHTHRTDSR